MLNRIANKTTIHGVKDAWQANWIGRAFFLMVFVCCITLMALQLKGLFHAYISQQVGTRITSTTRSDSTEVPSIYYCNKNWLPKIDALCDFNPAINDNSSFKKSYGRMYQECIHMVTYNISLDQHLFKDKITAEDKLGDLLDYLTLAVEPKQYCKPFLEYWKSMIKQELVNAIVQPLDDRTFDNRNVDVPFHRFNRPELSIITRNFAASILVNPILKLLESEFKQSLRTLVENAVSNVNLDAERVYTGCQACTAKVKSSSTVMTQVRDISGGELRQESFYFYMTNLFYDRRPSKFDPFARTYNALANYTLHPLAIFTSLEGVCWEFPTGPQNIRTNKDAIGQKNRHVVIHLAGIVHQMRMLGRQISKPDAVVASIVETLNIVFTLPRMVLSGNSYTDVAVSKQNGPDLHFNQKLRVDDTKSLVNIKYWTKSSAILNRKDWPCRPDPWTELDQAHCNQELSKIRQTKMACETYLPASESYSETPVTNNTCIYDYTNMFRDISLALGDVTFANWSYAQPLNFTHQLSSFGPSRVSHENRSDVISRLTEIHSDCPRPCTRTVFSQEISYPLPNEEDVRLCHMSLAYWLTPKSISYKPGRSMAHDPRRWFRLAYLLIAKNSRVETLMPTPYCSVIEYEQVEVQDHISEEYLLYHLHDLAASLGGTVGLWIGASVMSIVQLVYLCCLKKQFRRIRRKVTLRCSKKLGRKLKKWFGKIVLGHDGRTARK